MFLLHSLAIFILFSQTKCWNNMMFFYNQWSCLNNWSASFFFGKKRTVKGNGAQLSKLSVKLVGHVQRFLFSFHIFYDVWIPNTSFLFTSPWCYKADIHQMFVFAVQHSDSSKPRTTLLFMGLFWSAHFTASQSVSLFPYKFTSAVKYERQKYFSHISDWLWHTARGMCLDAQHVLLMLAGAAEPRQTDCVPENYTNTK